MKKTINGKDSIKPIFMLILISLVSTKMECGRKNIFQDLRAGDYGMVIKGSYRGTAEFIGSGEEYGPALKRFRRLIENNLDLLPAITRHYFRVPDVLNFEYKMVLRDRVRDRLVLRYYAPIHGDQLIAGYQLFLVFDPSRNELVEIYSSEVPLE